MDIKTMDSVLNKIYDKKILDINNEKCIFIDGSWGIGKTFAIDKYFKNKSEEFLYLYVSVFGKQNIKDIEKSLLLKLIPGLKDIKDDSLVIKMAKNITKDVGKKFLGINVGSYLDSFSIEDIKINEIAGKRIVLCIDDIERKSKDLEFKKILGLTERASKNFNVILIGNSKKLEDGDRKILEEYKEKIIDQVIKLDEINREVLDEIAGKFSLKSMEVVNVYISDIIGFGEPSFGEVGFLANNIYNLRVFEKYCELVLKIENMLSDYILDSNMLKICKTVIYDYFHPEDKKKRGSLSFDKYDIYRVIQKILINEEVDIILFEDHIADTSEVKQDIGKLYSSYMFTEDEYRTRLSKIQEKVDNKEFEYFKKIENTVSILSVLIEIGENIEGIKQKLVDIAIGLYDVEVGMSAPKLEYELWNNVDENGHEFECHKKVKNIIDLLNKGLEDKYRNYLDDKYEYAKQKKEYDELLSMYQYNQIEDSVIFKEMFEYYFNKLTLLYSEEDNSKLLSLIRNTKSNIANEYLKKVMKGETRITYLQKYKCLENELDRKEQFEAEEDQG